MGESLDRLTDRGTLVCRGCQALGLVSVLDLGRQPLANEMAYEPEAIDETFPLHLRICPRCGLGQLGEYVLPDRIFSQQYPYHSSLSSSWVDHAGRYVDQMVAELRLSREDLVVEVASNDGYLLTQMRDAGVSVLGIEPSGGVAELARSKGVPTLRRFFGQACAREVVQEHGHPRLITANNVMAHVPDLADFVAGLATLCDRRTLITVENPSFAELMKNTQFDTIYHEHFSYLTAHSVAWAAARSGLSLIKVERLSTHGGSNRYWLSLSGVQDVDRSVQATLAAERQTGLLDPAFWSDFSRRSTATVDGLQTWTRERRAVGRTVAGYGAAAKGNTLINAARLSAEDIAVVVDASPDKQGKYLPGSGIPVAAPGYLQTVVPDDVLIFPWNLAGEIAPLVRSLVPGAQPWTPIPTMRACT
jgi:hypothetical protein